MARCPYMASLLVHGRLVYTRCRRRAWGRGWHLHDAAVPEHLAVAHRHIRLRWRSSYAPDHHVGDTHRRPYDAVVAD